MRKILAYLFGLLLIIILPFIVLIRTAVFCHGQLYWYAWGCILMGVFVTAGLLMIYFIGIHRYSSGQLSSASTFRSSYAIALLAVGIYCGVCVWSLSTQNAKTEAVRKEFRSLHPILRLSVSTVIFLDKKLLITDGNRLPENYRQMGLKSKKHSLHYIQSSGYAHAIDVRTKDRSEIRNFFLKWYFKSMGFNVLRHVGTADHLHISIKSLDRPSAI